MEEKAQDFVLRLQEAYDKKDINLILELYEEHANSDIDWDSIPNYIADDLDELTDKCNELIY